MEAEQAMIKEAQEVLRKLSPPNQSYLMTLVRVAAAAENNARRLERKEETPPAGAASGR